MSAAGVEREPESVTIDHLVAVCGGVIHGVSSDDATPIVDVTHDSRQVGPGWLYCCIPGANVDGHDFAPQAVSAGASAVLSQRELDLPVPRIVVDDARAVMGLAAAEVHGRPSDHLTVIGVTGTNGKSSVVQLLDDIFRRAGSNTEIIGTVTGARTTPESSDLQRLLARALGEGVTTIAMEVSSHALSLHRVVGTRLRGRRLHQPRSRPPRLPWHRRVLLRGKVPPLRRRLRRHRSHQHRRPLWSAAGRRGPLVDGDRPHL